MQISTLDSYQYSKNRTILYIWAWDEYRSSVWKRLQKKNGKEKNGSLLDVQLFTGKKLARLLDTAKLRWKAILSLLAVPYQPNSAPQNASKIPLMVIYKKKFCYATSQGRMDFKTNILIADTIWQNLARSQVLRFGGAKFQSYVWNKFFWAQQNLGCTKRIWG